MIANVSLAGDQAGSTQSHDLDGSSARRVRMSVLVVEFVGVVVVIGCAALPVPATLARGASGRKHD